MVFSVECLRSGPRCLFPMFELLRQLFYISFPHAFPFPLYEDYGQDGADDDDDEYDII